MMTRFLAAADYTPEQSWALLEWCRQHGADEFTLKLLGLQGHGTPYTDQVEADLGAFRLPAAPRRHLNVYEGEDEVRPTHLWAITSDSVQVFRRYFEDGLFTHPVGDWTTGCIEDPVVYRHGQILLGIVSHEGEGILYVGEDEARDLQRRALPTRDAPVWIRDPAAAADR